MGPGTNRVHRAYQLFQSRFRPARMEAFLEFFKPGAETSILDVGGTSEFWLDSGRTLRVTILNISPGPEHLPPNFTYVQGSATSLPFPDRSFDIVFSNSMRVSIYAIGRVKSPGSQAQPGTPRVGARIEAHLSRSDRGCESERRQPPLLHAAY